MRIPVISEAELQNEAPLPTSSWLRLSPPLLQPRGRSRSIITLRRTHTEVGENWLWGSTKPWIPIGEFEDIIKENRGGGMGAEMIALCSLQLDSSVDLQLVP